MGNNNKYTSFEDGLRELRKQLLDNMTDQEKKEYQLGIAKENKLIKCDEFARRVEWLQNDSFIKKFIGNLGYSINNLFRGRNSFSRYERLFGGATMYCPIDREYIEQLINISILMGLSEPLKEDTTFYRGCIDLKTNGLNGLVTVTSDYQSAEKYSEGTILAITLPKGTRLLNIGAIMPKNDRTEAMDKEYLLPPCDILGDVKITTKNKGKEPNNYRNTTQYIESNATPLDFLNEFYMAMEYLPNDYEAFIYMFREDLKNHYNALNLLAKFLNIRYRKTEQKVKSYSLTGKINLPKK